MKSAFSIRVDKKLVEKIDRLAKKENRSRNNYIEYLLEKRVSKSA